MGRNRFVDEGDIVRLDLSDGDWIDIHRELSYGAQQRMAMSGLRSVKPGEDAEIAIDWDRFAIARIEAWVVAWSFRDSSNSPRQVTRVNIERLHPDTAQEIIEALDRHQEAQEAITASPNGVTPLTPA